MSNNRDYNGPRRVGQRNIPHEEPAKKYGRRLNAPYGEPHEYKSDSDALAAGTGRHVFQHHAHTQYEDELEEPLSAHFDPEPPFEGPYYEDDSDPGPYLEEPEEFYEEASEPPFNPNKARRDPYQEFEPLDDDLVTYDEFGRKRKKKRIREEKLMTKSRAIWGWVISIIAAVAIAFIVRTFFFEIIVVDGESMLPTLQSDEKLAVEKVSRYFGLPEHGDIIIVHYPNMSGTYVKRVIALPGETVEVKDSTVYVNGEPLSEPYINSAEPYIDMAPVTVPEDTVFVMGDNRAHSLDSRTAYIGPIARSEIVGHATYVIWPLDNIHSVQ